MHRTQGCDSFVLFSEFKNEFFDSVCIAALLDAS